MKVKRILAITLSALMITGTVSSAAASAQETPKEYNYVALGDSIAAGYGLEKSDAAAGLSGDRALILSEDLIANPIKGAYANVFGNLMNDIVADKGYTVNTANLSSTAYLAADVSKTILNDGYKGGMATYILESFLGSGTSEPLSNYHNIYCKYLSNADLVSIQLGGNDIVLSLLNNMVGNKNPIINATGMSIMLTLFGCDYTTALGAGIQLIVAAKDDITLYTLAEASQFFSDIAANSEQYVTNASEQVRGVIDAVKTINNKADIAVVGMFNPYGNSLEYNGQVYNISTILTNIFVRAVEEFCGEEIETPDVAALSDESAEVENDKYEDAVQDLVVFSEDEGVNVDQNGENVDENIPTDTNKLNDFIAAAKEKAEKYKEIISNKGEEYKEKTQEFIDECVDYAQQEYNKAKDAAQDKYDELKVKYDQLSASSKKKVKKLLTIIAEEIAYPIQYLTAGKNVDPQIKLLNTQLKDIAEETKSTFVDVYNISNECNSDPHPNAQGHYEIAELMRDTLKDTVLAKISDDPKIIIGDVTGDGNVGISDAILLQKYITNFATLDSRQLQAADFNGDGKVNTIDAIALSKYIASVKVS